MTLPVFCSAAYSTQGRRDGVNEDNYLLIHPVQKTWAQYLKGQCVESLELLNWKPEKIRLVVADGMGGHSHGQFASESLIQEILKMPPCDNVSELAAQIHAVHNHLLATFSGTEHNRPGSTLIMADIDIATGLCVVGNVGDSRAYLLRGDKCYQLNHDHIYSEFAWRDGDISDEQYFAVRKGYNHRLTQAMGYGSFGILCDNTGTRPYQYQPQLRLDFKNDGQIWQPEWDEIKEQHRDVFLVQLLENDRLLLASDGLWSNTADNSPKWLAGFKPTTPLIKLVEAALEAGSQDNITVVMCAKHEKCRNSGLPPSKKSTLQGIRERMTRIWQ